MDYSSVICSQYWASLEMLKQTIVKCPLSVWDNPDDKTKFWHIAFHTLFYTHLYLQDSGQEFRPWAKHRKDYQFLGKLPWPPYTKPVVDVPYSLEDVLAYQAFCQEQVEERVPLLNLEAGSGFDWLPFGKLELQFYNIRHIQQHTGELMERLGTCADIELDWIAWKRGE
jgi:hypothetical protein